MSPIIIGIFDMRIVDTKTFYSLPEGTLFSYLSHYEIGPLMIKGETSFYSGPEVKQIEQGQPFDFFYTELVYPHMRDDEQYVDALNDMTTTGESRPNMLSSTRDGCFDETQMYVVYDKDDIECFIAKLQEVRKNIMLQAYATHLEERGLLLGDEIMKGTK